MQLAPLHNHVVQVDEDVANVSAPASDEDLLRLQRRLLENGRVALVDLRRRLRPVGVVVLCYDNDLVPLAHDGVGLGVQRDAAVGAPDANGNGVREAAYEVQPSHALQLWPLPHVELVALEAQERLVDLRQARAPARHEHQAAEDVVRGHCLGHRAANHLEQGLVANVPDLRDDVALEAERQRAEHQDTPQDLSIGLVRLAVRRQDDDGPRFVRADFHEVVREQGRAAPEDDLGAQEVPLWQLHSELPLHVLLSILGHHNDDSSALTLVRHAQLLNEKDRLLCPPQDQGVVTFDHS
mmetsp:Transcript_47982/g.138924  ORF Transcript_47982/g.138924 Transcript_47982/m.138924 type:complete len:296 (+) Transcript_47982:1320-2207(+)